MSLETAVMGSEMGDIFWDLPPWIVYAPGYDVGCTIYVANPTDTEKEYTLMSRLYLNETVISEEAIKVFGYAWFKVDPEDFVRLRGALRFEETDVNLAVLLIERETEQIADSVLTSLVAPTLATLPPTWPEVPGITDTTAFDWNSLLAMMIPVAMIGMVAPAFRPRDEREETALAATEERRLLPPGREG